MMNQLLVAATDIVELDQTSLSSGSGVNTDVSIAPQNGCWCSNSCNLERDLNPEKIVSRKIIAINAQTALAS